MAYSRLLAPPAKLPFPEEHWQREEGCTHNASKLSQRPGQDGVKINWRTFSAIQLFSLEDSESCVVYISQYTSATALILDFSWKYLPKFHVGPRNFMPYTQYHIGCDTVVCTKFLNRTSFNKVRAFLQKCMTDFYNKKKSFQLTLHMSGL